MGTAPIRIITAPSSLGLRPGVDGLEPGTWAAPSALLAAGLASSVGGASRVDLPRLPYSYDSQPATRIRNGLGIRELGLLIAEAVADAVRDEQFPLVVGGDCSILLGCLAGARRAGPCALLHVDGHTDFFHPGNYDSARSLGSAAGMDLALATGRGELLLTHWPVAGSPLVPDEDVFQIGDREAEVDGHGQLPPTIAGLTVQEVLRIGIDAAVEKVSQRIAERGAERSWLHLDLDVLDASVMPAVDSPGAPGLDFQQASSLLAGLLNGAPVIGMDVAIYDPSLDPDGSYAAAIVRSLATALASHAELIA